MADPEIVLYHYAYSPYARRVVWYLTLRGIPFSQCLQPPVMPRPDVSRLGIAYRRIPILSIGRDVYLDTRLQLSKLEEQFPSHPRLGSPAADQRAVERLLSDLVTDGGVFARAAQLIPPELPLMRDERFRRDREDMTGNPWSAEALRRGRPEALRETARTFALLETTLLADGRDWLLKTDAPGLADVEAVWPLLWLAGMEGALPAEAVSAAAYPRVFAWMGRFEAAVARARKQGPKTRTLSSEEAAAAIRDAQGVDDGGKDGVDEKDPVAAALGLGQGDVVTVWPADTGSGHKDVGRLVRLDAEEVVIEVDGRDGGGSLRVHAPRHGFKIRKGAEAQGGKL